jgi:hypothetical protein
VLWFLFWFSLSGSASGAKARTDEKGFIAALKRCATQNQGLAGNCKALIDWVALTAALEGVCYPQTK